jgi:epoxyqueuosine reductase
MDQADLFSGDFTLRHRAVSVDHLKELQADIDRLENEGKISRNEVFRRYISDKQFRIPEDFSDAKSLIIIAAFTKPMLVNFHLGGRKHEVVLPPAYYDDGLTMEMLRDYVLKEVVDEPGHRIESASVHLKLLAVRSGLGKYGRNNLCYVEGMGSMLALYAFFTDYPCEDSWTEVSMMDNCKNCRICMNSCPNKCISEQNFVIDVSRCLSLFNEIKGKFPEWIRPDAHNALMGCFRCQSCCPANREVIKLAGRLEDVTEEETRRILAGTPDEESLNSISRKLKGFYPTQSEEDFPVFTRNLRVLLRPETKRAFRFDTSS